MNKIANKLKKNLISNWPLLLLILYFSLFYFNFISLVTADLGRHIVNGREILASGLSPINTKVLSENYYSYSQTNFPFINHHWLFGVMVYFIQQSFDFSGLTILNLFFYISAFSFALLLAKKKSSTWFTFFAGLVAIPLITSRTEVRPEALSLFMFSGFFFIFTMIDKFFSRKTNAKHKLLLLIVLLLLVGQVIWTNSHLFFIFGPFISGLFLVNNILQNIFTKKTNKLFTHQTIFLFIITIGLFGATTINPHGINGSLSPFHIFDNYGYRVAENQSTWFMISIKNQIVKYSYFIISAVLGLASFSSLIISRKLKKPNTKNTYNYFIPLISVLIFGTMTQVINRTSSFFGIILIPALAQNLFFIYQNHRQKINKLFNNALFLMTISPIIIGIIIFLIYSKLLFPPINNIGTGLAPQINASAKFFKNNKLSGPIFNNYDLGGYLIYHFFPEQKVFVDNRPEAYSEDFFKNKYIAAQENEKSWKQISHEYNFETIYYFRLDQTNWTPKFLHRRVLDPNWVPVYVDPYILIFVKNNDKNLEIIKKYELPKEIFSLTNLN